MAAKAAKALLAQVEQVLGKSGTDFVKTLGDDLVGAAANAGFEHLLGDGGATSPYDAAGIRENLNKADRIMGVGKGGGIMGMGKGGGDCAPDCWANCNAVAKRKRESCRESVRR